ncbi:conserved hypothetical protein [Hoeflea sp. EC-HK425]|nr:conserved hypothetical protein [Hoeflea sp. EC-HK425]
MTYLCVHGTCIDRARMVRRHCVILPVHGGRAVRMRVLGMLINVIMMMAGRPRNLLLWHKVHAAFRAVAGACLPDFRMHRADEPLRRACR